jgi:hypothetical protein
MATTVCKFCGVPIRFVKTPAGKQMPINTQPTRFGDVLVDMRDNGRVVTGHEATALRGVHGLLYVRHAKTCRNRGRQLTLGGA